MRQVEMSTGMSEVIKIWGVGRVLIGGHYEPPFPVEIGLTDLQKYGGGGMRPLGPLLPTSLGYTHCTAN